MPENWMSSGLAFSGAGWSFWAPATVQDTMAKRRAEKYFTRSVFEFKYDSGLTKIRRRNVSRSHFVPRKSLWLTEI